jgi:hypothetical protein
MNVLGQAIDRANPLLLPERDKPYVLKNVFEKIADGCRDEVVLDFGDSCLRIGVDINTDTLVLRFRSMPFRPTKRWVSLRSAEPWKKCDGKECGWTWLAVNQQGYLDTVLISFDGIVPTVMLQAIASSVEVFTITPAKTVAVAKTGGNGRPHGTNRRSP